MLTNSDINDFNFPKTLETIISGPLDDPAIYGHVKNATIEIRGILHEYNIKSDMLKNLFLFVTGYTDTNPNSLVTIDAPNLANL